MSKDPCKEQSSTTVLYQSLEEPKKEDEAQSMPVVTMSLVEVGEFLLFLFSALCTTAELGMPHFPNPLHAYCSHTTRTFVPDSFLAFALPFCSSTVILTLSVD